MDYQRSNILVADENFIANLDLTMIAGKNFPESSVPFHQLILVNEAAVREYGFDQPLDMVGQIFESKYGEETLEVIGVVADFRFKMLMNEHRIGPLVIRNQPAQFNYVQVKITSSNVPATLETLESKWEGIDPNHPFKYNFYDEQLESMYQGIFDLVSILGFIAFISISIACLGILGMAVYTTERRIKEVGIRKVMGAGTFSIVLLLSKGFLKILIISVLIGAPLSYLLNNLWLQNFPNRVGFGWGTLLLGAVLLMLLGMVTVGSQTLWVSTKNPVNSLKSE